jgi:hypothetical protein
MIKLEFRLGGYEDAKGVPVSLVMMRDGQDIWETKAYDGPLRRNQGKLFGKWRELCGFNKESLPIIPCEISEETALEIILGLHDD